RLQVGHGDAEPTRPPGAGRQRSVPGVGDSTATGEDRMPESIPASLVIDTLKETFREARAALAAEVAEPPMHTHLGWILSVPDTHQKTVLAALDKRTRSGSSPARPRTKPPASRPGSTSAVSRSCS